MAQDMLFDRMTLRLFEPGSGDFGPGTTSDCPAFGEWCAVAIRPGFQFPEFQCYYCEGPIPEGSYLASSRGFVSFASENNAGLLL